MSSAAAGRRLEIPRRHVADIELPREVEGLYELAYNLWWTWHPGARDLFSKIDGQAWAHYRNPVELLINVDRLHWETLLESESFLDAYHDVERAFDRYMRSERSPHSSPPTEVDVGTIAYFTMEFGLHQCLAIYSGGLGVLSGDHVKSASDLGLPLVGVGLLYRSGYFRQTVDADGRQQHIYPEQDFTRLPIRPAATATGGDVRVEVPIAEAGSERAVAVKVWVVQVGRVPVLLLDSDLPANDPADRPITNTLYVQGRATRLAQEVVLGIGGVRALAALEIEPDVWHVNEGHSALLQLERLRRLGVSGSPESLSLDEGIERLRRDTVFTTHTPVPAGNEQFDAELAHEHLAPWGDRLGCGWEPIRRLARSAPHGTRDSFNLTALALRTCRFANGVSAIHAETSRRMWSHLFEHGGDGSGADEVSAGGPAEARIDHITNGVHLPTWIGREMRSLLARRLGEDWQARVRPWGETDAGRELSELDDLELWEAHLAQKRRLGRFLRSRLRDQFARHGRSPAELREVETFFSTEALTIGFARRFATYKRASLVFHDAHALRHLVESESRPLQIVFAGKAHPADRPGQELIRHIFQLGLSGPFRARVFFLENYDMRIARMLVQGVDLWLNTPRRPQEASGTSGQKAAINGVLNCSILDGWWPEAYDGSNGWAIETTDEEDPQRQDTRDAQELYRLLEDEVLPTYFERDGEGLPRRWIEMMRRSIVTVTPRFSTDRMVREYVEKAYGG